MLAWLRSPQSFRLRLTALLLVTFWSGVFLAPLLSVHSANNTSQPPAPRPLKVSATQQKPAKGGDATRGSKNNPIFVKAITTPENQEEATNDAPYQEQRTADKHVVEIGIAAIVFGSLQTVALFLTFWVMRQTSIRQLRAYLAVETRGIRDPVVGFQTEAVFVIKNHGDTPAYGVKYLAGLIVLPYPLPRRIGDVFVPHEGQTDPDLTLQKDGEHTCEGFFPTETKKFTAADLAAATSDKHRLYLIVQVYYRDTFGINRRTRLAAFMEPDQLKAMANVKPGQIPKPGKFDWSLADTYNDAD